MNYSPNGQSRSMPHSIEAEEYLLSCVMLDGAEVISRCIAANLTAESFYDTRHGLLFRIALDLHARGKSCDVAIIAEELKTTNQLDVIGGYAFVTQVSSRIPTTAQAGYFIEKVREQALLRAAIRTATQIIENARNLSGDVDEFITTSWQRIHSLAEASTPVSAVSEWKERRAGFGRVIKDHVPTLYLRDVPIFNRGNIGLITALQKSGKSAVSGAVLGAIVAGPDQRGDTLGFRGYNEHNHAVLHLDTEQSSKDHETLVETVKRRAQVTQLPPWLYSYGVKGISAEQLRRRLSRLLRELKRAHGGVYMVLLDGVADFVTDPNDPKECNPFVKELEAVATDFECSLLGIIHLNPAPTGQKSKSRGHLGSELERKCELDLRLTKDADGVTTIFTGCQRHAPILEKNGPRFSWDSKEGMHLSLSSTNQQAHDEAERETLRELAADCYTDSQTRMRYSALVSAIEKTAKCKERTAQEKVKRMKKLGVIREVQPRFWELVI